MDDKIVTFPGRRGSHGPHGGGDGPEDPMLETRVARLEADVAEIRADVREIRSAVRALDERLNRVDVGIGRIDAKLDARPTAWTLVTVVGANFLATAAMIVAVVALFGGRA